MAISSLHLHSSELPDLPDLPHKHATQGQKRKRYHNGDDENVSVKPAKRLDSFAEDDLAQAGARRADTIDDAGDGRCRALAHLFPAKVRRGTNADQVVQTAAEKAEEKETEGEGSLAHFLVSKGYYEADKA